MPSLGDVPRPSSSIRTKESWVDRPVAVQQPSETLDTPDSPSIIADEDISSANVLNPLSISSSLDNRVKRAS